jgi:outer membrane immunogenic protein
LGEEIIMRFHRFALAALAAACLSVGLGQAAIAADMPVKAHRVGVTSNWTGFYAGVNGGYAWKDSSASISPGDPATAFVTGGGHYIADPATTSFSANGGLGGIQIGYNWQFDRNWVAGIEADFDDSDIKGSGNAPVNMSGFGPNFATLNASQKVEWFGTVRARLGYLPTNNLLLYATGGLAYGKVNESANVGVNAGGVIGFGISGYSFACSNPPASGYGGPTCFSGSQSRTAVGWTAGGGAEYQIARNVTLKAEYLYVNLGNEGFSIPAASVFGGGTPSFLKVGFSAAAFNIARVGINYQF